MDEEAVDFDLVGVDASVANAFRRILMAEVGMLPQCTASEPPSNSNDLRFLRLLLRKCTFGTTLQSFKTRSSHIGWA